MINFDIRTAFLIVSLLYLIMPTVAWIVLARQQSRSVALWCGGGLIFGIGVLLIGLRGAVPTWVTLPLANLLMFTSLLMRIQALRLDFKTPWRTSWMTTATLLFVLIFEGINRSGNAAFRIQFAALAYSALLLELVYQAWRIARLQRNYSALWIAGSYLLLALMMLLRVIMLAGGWSSADQMATSLDLILLTLTGVLSSVVGHIGFVGMFLERSVQQQIEAAARYATNQRLGAIIEQKIFGVAEADLEGRLLTVNDRYCEITGYSREELLGKPFQEFVPPTELTVTLERQEQIVSTDTPSVIEECYRRKDGSLVWTNVSGAVIRNDAGQPVSIVAVVLDITERKQAEEEIRRLNTDLERKVEARTAELVSTQARIIEAMAQVAQSEAKFRGMFEQSPVGVALFDSQTGQLIEINDRLTQIMGLTREELTTIGWMPVTHPDDLRVELEHLARLKAGEITGFRMEKRYRHPDGAIVWGHLTVTAVTMGEGIHCHLALVEDITERKRYEYELEQARRAAEAATRAKSEFLANMSHEIRTPMNGVLGLTQLLEQEPLSPDQLDMVRRIRASGRTLLGIINDILDFSKIEAGQLRIERRPFALRPLLGHLDSLLGSTARDKGLDLRIEAPAGVTGGLVGDDLRLEQVLINLVGNAIKFTEQGEIRLLVHPVDLTATAARLRFEVRDTGVGIAPAALANLFQPFAQADGSITRRFGGTGLGLSISKRLVELMGGTIGVESHVGVGSVFWFELPFERTTDVAAEPGAGAQEAVPTGPRLAGRRFLVVDDSNINREVVRRALTREGALVVPAEDGRQALDALQQSPGGFDAVLMDVQMPVMDGLTATRLLRSELGLLDLPVIAFTAGVLPEERQKALDAGVNGFLAKPVELEEMIAVLRGLPGPSPSVAT